MDQVVHSHHAAVFHTFSTFRDFLSTLWYPAKVSSLSHAFWSSHTASCHSCQFLQWLIWDWMEESSPESDQATSFLMIALIKIFNGRGWPIWGVQLTGPLIISGLSVLIGWYARYTGGDKWLQSVKIISSGFENQTHWRWHVAGASNTSQRRTMFLAK